MLSRRILDKARQSRGRRKGAAAVEFALVALPFLGLMLAIFEVAIILTVNSVLESAVMQSGRLVRTGQVSRMATADDFKREICDRMAVFGGACMSRIQIDLQPVASFTNPGITNPIEDGEFDPDRLRFDIGEARNFMLMRVWYRQPIVSPFLGHAMMRLNNGDTLMHAATAFRNEPY